MPRRQSRLLLVGLLTSPSRPRTWSKGFPPPRRSTAPRRPAQRQRRRLQRQITQGQGPAQVRARAPRHRRQALDAVSPPDLRQGRALPPDPEAIPRQADAGSDRSPSCRSSSTPSAPTTTGVVHIAPSHGDTPLQAFHARIKARPDSPHRHPPTTASATTGRQAGVVTLRYLSRLHHIGIGCGCRAPPVTSAGRQQARPRRPLRTAR